MQLFNLPCALGPFWSSFEIFSMGEVKINASEIAQLPIKTEYF
jgi:hypothetical protein